MIRPADRTMGACAGTAVLAQTAGDLNALASAASRYAAHGVAGTRQPVMLDLREIKGESALLPGALMTKALDIQRWTFFYDAGPNPGDEGAAPEAASKSASCKCVNSLFSDFHFSPKPIPATKSLEYTWVAVTLDQAIQQLNLQGYVRGFSDVKLMRPDQPDIPDGFVYIFDCPWERTLVAISASSGETTWLEHY
jgi:hypothetical protein